MRSLLDVNVVLALLDADHVDHRLARAFLADHAEDGWASCPITENGFVRIISQPRYPSPIPVTGAIERLAEATRTPSHAFWPDDVTVLDPDTIDHSRVMGPRQVTDAYLLALAVNRGGRFVTLDTSVSLDTVPGATADHLVVLGGRT